MQYIFSSFNEELEVSNKFPEFELHEQWKEKSGLKATPTVLVNGYRLPDNFKIEDIRYVSEMDIK